MSKVRALVYGLYPRSEKLRTSISKWERGAIATGDLESAITGERVEVSALFSRAGVWKYTDPLSNWNDILRMTCAMLTGVSLGRLTRYKETNTFYKQPELRSYPEFNPEPPRADHDTYLPGEFYRPAGPGYIHFLPGIDSFVNMSSVSGDLDKDKLKVSLLSAYEEMISHYNIHSLLLFEPYPDEIATSDYNELFSSVGAYYVVENFSDGFFRLIRNEPNAIISSSPGDIGAIMSHAAIPGVALFNSQNTKIEESKAIRDKALELAEKAGADNFIVTHTEYLDFLPRIIADRKVEAIAGAGDAI